MRKTQVVLLILSLAACAVSIAALTIALTRQGITMDESIPRLTVSSMAFTDGGAIPDRYTGVGADVSPDILLESLSEKAVSVAIVMEDLDVPVIKTLTHWVVWNLPAQAMLAEAVPYGASPGLGNAVQGVAYGRNRYAGPNPPFGTHRYRFHVFVLDTTLDLAASAGKSDLLAAAEGHILQYGSLTGTYSKP